MRNFIVDSITDTKSEYRYSLTLLEAGRTVKIYNFITKEDAIYAGTMYNALSKFPKDIEDDLSFWCEVI